MTIKINVPNTFSHYIKFRTRFYVACERIQRLRLHFDFIEMYSDV